MTKEEETSRGTGALTRLEDHVAVEFGAQAGQYHFRCDSITFLDTLEVERSVNIHFHH